MLKRFWNWILSLFSPKPQSMLDELNSLAGKASLLRQAFDESAKARAGQSDPNVLSEGDRIFKAEVGNVPVFLPVEVVAPQMDPVLWGDYISIKTSNAHKTEEWPQGWRGTIEENIEFTFIHNLAKLVGLNIGKFDNILNIDPYAWDEKGGRVDYTLKQCLEGDLTRDEGYLTVEPQSWGGCYVGCCKNLSFTPDSDWLKPEVVWGLQPTMEFVVFMWVVEYAIKIMIRALAEDPSLETSASMQYGKTFYSKVLNAAEPAQAFKQAQANIERDLAA